MTAVIGIAVIAAAIWFVWEPPPAPSNPSPPELPTP